LPKPYNLDTVVDRKNVRQKNCETSVNKRNNKRIIKREKPIMNNPLLSIKLRIKHLIYIVPNMASFLVSGIPTLLPLNICGLVRLRGLGTIKIGAGFRGNSGQDFNPIGGDDGINLVAGNGALILIGQNVGVSNSTFVARKKIEIGNNVLIGGSVSVYDTDFHSTNFQHRKKKTLDQKMTKSQEVCIHDDVFIGAHSLILKGVEIGKGSVVGAGSVVTKNVPSYEIWAGNPAKKIGDITD
jgi:acetyltransferase-like isoleucine patch superfamily enzyme